MLKSDILQNFKNFNSHTTDYLGVMYMNIYNDLPKCYRVYYGENDKLTYQDSVESFYNARKTIKIKIDSRKLLQNLIKVQDKYNLEIFCYSPHEYLILGNRGYEQSNDDMSTKNFLINVALSEDGDMANWYEEIFCNKNDIKDVFDFVKEYFEASIKENKVDFGIAAIDAANNLYTTWYDYKTHVIDIDTNYNDDFKEIYDKMYELLNNNDSSELILLYGEPGTGKSSLIKHFISELQEKDFVFIDGALLANASQEKLMSYFLENQDTIFILEDCEKALMNREHSFNPIMPVLLNITDGIIGDVLGIKLICTFNTALRNIDPALIRKGRLSLKYEFKKLSKEKVRKILKDDTINQDMTLADIYNYKEENDFSKKNEKKIGF